MIRWLTQMAWNLGHRERYRLLEERVKRLEYWVEVHHPLVPTYASPEQVKVRGYWDLGVHEE